MILKEYTVLSAIIESTAYTAESFVASSSNYNVFNAEATLNADMKPRPTGDGFSKRPSTVGLQSGTVTFGLDLHGDGSGSVPAWADMFFPCCGLVRDPLGANPTRFVPRSRPPHEGGATDYLVRTATLAVNEQGRQKLVRGCMGTAVLVFPTGQDCYIEFNFQGAWSGVSDQALPTPSYPTELPLRYAAADILLGGETPCIQELRIDLGNNVALRPCQTASDGSGYRGAVVTDRNLGGSIDPEAELVADDDTFGDWINANPRAFTTSFKDDNDQVNISIPQFQFINIGNGDRGGIRVDPVSFEAKRNAVVDDEFYIEFAAAP